MLQLFLLLLTAISTFLAAVTDPGESLFKSGIYITSWGEDVVTVIRHIHSPVRKPRRAPRKRALDLHYNCTRILPVFGPTIFPQIITSYLEPIPVSRRPPSSHVMPTGITTGAPLSSASWMEPSATPKAPDYEPASTGHTVSPWPMTWEIFFKMAGLLVVGFSCGTVFGAGLGSARPEALGPGAKKAKVPRRRKFIGLPLEAPRTLDPMANLVLVTGLLPASSPSLATAGADDAPASPPHQDDESGIEVDDVPVSSAQVIPPQPASAQNLVAPPAPPSPPSPARLPITPALCGQPLPTEERLQERPNRVLQILDGGHLAAAVADVPEGEVESPSPPRAETRAPSPAHRPRNASPGPSSSSRPLPPLAAALEAETSRMALSEITPQPPRPDPSKSKLPIQQPAAPSAPSGVRPGRENVRPVLAAPSQGRALAHKRSTAEEGVRSGRPSHRPTVEETKARRDASGVRPAVVQGRPALSHRRSTGEVAGRLGLASHRTAVEEPQADGEGDEREDGTSQKLAAQVPAAPPRSWRHTYARSAATQAGRALQRGHSSGVT
ncbi:hypothetical protein B0H13DRAFT_2263777 [Mycena leptocephala]|nr:hypothetical protein B0H13DRAFT_2263777 [Mycena leptocephala]